MTDVEMKAIHQLAQAEQEAALALEKTQEELLRLQEDSMLRISQEKALLQEEREFEQKQIQLRYEEDFLRKKQEVMGITTREIEKLQTIPDLLRKRALTTILERVVSRDGNYGNAEVSVDDPA